jgi:cell division protein YceG involved in septum cleavage
MQEEIKKALEQFFALSDKIQADLSGRWREHTNRRTLIAVSTCALVIVAMYFFTIRAPGSFVPETLVTIPDGATLRQAALILEENHIVRSPIMLRLVVTAMGYQKNVHAGDYLFKERKGVFAVARAISIGAFGLEPTRIRVLEGATTAEMAQLFNKSLQRFDEARFISLAQPMEGYLFPDTYFFLPNATEDISIHQ